MGRANLALKRGLIFLTATATIAASAVSQAQASDGFHREALLNIGAGLSAPHQVEKLPGDMVFAEFTEGVSVVAPVGSTISYGSRAADDGRSGEDWLLITEPHDAESASYPDARDLAIQVGMFSPQEAAALGLQSGGTPSSCADIDNSHGWMHGCYRRVVGNKSGGGTYWGQESVATAQSKSIYELMNAKTKHDYASITEVRYWEPISAINPSQCGNYSIGYSGYGISVSASSTICPTRLSIDLAGGSRAHGVWESYIGAWRTAVATMVVDRIWVPSGYSTGFEYGVSFFWKLV